MFVPAVNFTLTEGELANLGKYLESGGFLLADAGIWVGGDTDSFIRQMIRDAWRRWDGTPDSGGCRPIIRSTTLSSTLTVRPRP